MTRLKKSGRPLGRPPGIKSRKKIIHILGIRRVYSRGFEAAVFLHPEILRQAGLSIGDRIMPVAGPDGVILLIPMARRANKNGYLPLSKSIPNDVIYRDIEG